jgi:hypothetical protein
VLEASFSKIRIKHQASSIKHRRSSIEEHGLSYVAFSRATRLSNIGIIGGMDGPRLTSAISKLKKVKNRLMEDVRLDSMHATTIEKLENLRND